MYLSSFHFMDLQNNSIASRKGQITQLYSCNNFVSDKAWQVKLICKMIVKPLIPTIVWILYLPVTLPFLICNSGVYKQQHCTITYSQSPVILRHLRCSTQYRHFRVSFNLLSNPGTSTKCCMSQRAVSPLGILLD